MLIVFGLGCLVVGGFLVLFVVCWLLCLRMFVGLLGIWFGDFVLRLVFAEWLGLVR